MTKEQIKNILTDIRFWIILFFILRLAGITNAPLEIGHNWRQSLTNMIARNFLEGDSNIFYPKIDMSGNGSGIIGSEFPLFNYIIYLVSEIFGYTHWYGRLINLLVSSVGIFYFYKLVQKICDKQIAFNATVIMLCSIWFSFSRKIMPDTFSVALVIIGLYYAYLFLSEGNKVHLLFYFLLITCGMLCKIPALSLVSCLAIIPFIKEISFSKKVLIIICTVVSVSIVSLWYFYWVPYLVRTYQFQLYFPKGIKEGLLEILPLWWDCIQRFTVTAFYSFIALIVFAVGVFIVATSEKKYLKATLAIITIVFFVFIIKTGAVFPLHNYYIIPFIPVMALIAGYGLSKMSKKYQFIILVLISVEGIANQFHDFRIPEREHYKLALEKAVISHVPADKLVIINGTQSPQQLYFAHRKGWTVDNYVINKNSLDSLGKMGASFLIINTTSYTQPIEYYPRVFSGNNYDIYRIRE